MKKRIKEFGRESISLVGAGIAFGSLAGVDSSGASSALASGVGKVAPLVSLKLTTGILTDMHKEINKKRRY